MITMPSQQFPYAKARVIIYPVFEAKRKIVNMTKANIEQTRQSN